MRPGQGCLRDPRRHPGFGFLDARGNHTGFDIDLCRAVAAATLGDAVELRIIDAAERGPVMQADEVDLLTFVTTWTSSRDAAWGDFVPTMFYDGQGFMVDLEANYLTGEIPSELGRLSNLTELFLHFNRLTGGIPPELGSLSVSMIRTYIPPRQVGDGPWTPWYADYYHRWV